MLTLLLCPQLAVAQSSADSLIADTMASTPSEPEAEAEVVEPEGNLSVQNMSEPDDLEEGIIDAPPPDSVDDTVILGPTRPAPPDSSNSDESVPNQFSGAPRPGTDRGNTAPSLRGSEDTTALVGPTRPVPFAPASPFPFSRYAALGSKTPFGKPTAVETKSGPSPFDNMFVKGYGTLDQDSYFVVIGTKDKKTNYSIATNRPDRGLELVGVEEAEEITATKVRLRKDGQEGTVGFDEAQMMLSRQAAVGTAAPQESSAGNEPRVRRPRVPRRIRTVPRRALPSTTPANSQSVPPSSR